MGALRRKLLDEELRAFERRSLEITTFESAEVGRHTQQDSSHIVQIIIIIINNLVCLAAVSNICLSHVLFFLPTTFLTT